jgi:CheY-like chemotaxis protein
MKLLVIEDGHEYTDLLARFMPELDVTRAGTGPDALELLGQRDFDAIFLDMRFERAPESALLGDIGSALDRHNGDPGRAIAHLQDHQGLYILSALREAGRALPVLIAYDFSLEPARWGRLRDRFGPVAFAADLAGPAEVRAQLAELVGQRG